SLGFASPLTPGLGGPLSRGPLHRRKLPNDRDLLTIHNHLRLPREPPIRNPPQEPPPYLPSSINRSTLLLRTHVIMITALLRVRKLLDERLPSALARALLLTAR